MIIKRHFPAILHLLSHHRDQPQIAKAKRQSLPQCATCDTNKTLGTKLSRETPREIQRLEDKRSEVHKVLMRVVQPRS